MKKTVKNFILISMLILTIGLCTGCSNTVTTSNKANDNKVTLEKFNKIKTGMTYEQVVEIIGEEGTLDSETELMNVKTQIYHWYAKNHMSNAIITFSNNKVTSKTQTALK